MIIKFTLSNWTSFRDTVEFSMIASREKQHRERLAAIDKYGVKVLPVAAIYGGNASGKTNLISALDFLKWMVTDGPKDENQIPVMPFLLDEAKDLASTFHLEILVDDTIYEFSLTLDKDQIIEEKLTEIRSRSEKVLFLRTAEEGGKIELHDSLPDQDFLKFAFRGTRSNQLFINNTVSQKIDTFRPVYDWFKKTLTLIGPSSYYDGFNFLTVQDHPLNQLVNNILSQLDTGVQRLGTEDIPQGASSFNSDTKKELMEEIKPGDSKTYITSTSRERLIVSRKDNELLVKKIVSFHHDAEGKDVQFDMEMESDGTLRSFDLIPAFVALSLPKSEYVFVIDELDRSLHSLLTRQLLEFYFDHCNAAHRSQLIFTTHDLSLIDQELFRRDELWATERNYDGVTSLFSFGEFNENRKDTDLRKAYKQGRMGGIPRLSSIDAQEAE